MDYLIFHFAFSICLWVLMVDGHAGHDHQQSASAAPNKSEELAKIEKKWGVEDFIRDIDHVKEDLETVIHLSGTGELTQEETLFYMFRMHDFDDNSKLDGLEIMAVVQHGTGGNATVTELSANVDAVLEMDGDKDGFLSYPELKQTLKPKAEASGPTKI